MEKESKITPWEVEGKVDYEKIVREFGLREIDEEMLERIRRFTQDLHVLLRRRYFLPIEI